MTFRKHIASPFLKPALATSRRDGGYFGWTDRYGVRASVEAHRDVIEQKRPHFVADF